MADTFAGKREACQLCGKDIRFAFFVDGKTTSSAQGGWALMCLPCYELHGVKPLGPKRGQLYNAKGEKVDG